MAPADSVRAIVRARESVTVSLNTDACTSRPISATLNPPSSPARMALRMFLLVVSPTRPANVLERLVMASSTSGESSEKDSPTPPACRAPTMYMSPISLRNRSRHAI